MASCGGNGKRFLGIAVIALFSTAFLWRCANMGTPQGGPVDSLPPKVMGATPFFNTTNFNGKKIYITFDEYIQLKDQQKEFYTSPMMKKKPQLTVKGKGVQIEILDTLKPNTTYALNFGNSIRDNNEGNPLNGFRYVFSTGPEIDSMYMSGYTVNAYKKDSVPKTLVFFYEATDSIFNTQPYKELSNRSRPDSVRAYDSTLFRVKPSIIGRAESNGIFLAQNLKPVDYVVYGIEDTNGNQTYEPGTDKVAFMERTYNPAKLPDFLAWYDTTRMYINAEPQIYMRMFMDKQFNRQNLAASKRPSQHKIELFFNAPYPQIDSLTLEGISPDKIITEYVTQGRDTINLWLNVPSEQLPDTIKGRITYLKHDSINNLLPNTEQLKLYWKYIESKEEEKARQKEEKEREKAEKDGTEYTPPKKPNPFKYNISAKGDINPEENVKISFDYPLTWIDSTRISLVRIADDKSQYRVKYDLKRDSADIKNWILSANWQQGSKYQIEIPDSVFVNVAGQRNDSIKSDFSILSPEKFGTLTVHVKGKADSSLYVLQLLSDKDAVLQEKKFAKTGTYVFSYVNPGAVKFRVIEDMNGNGIWDTGDLIVHREPEHVELYVPENGNELITMKVNWDIEISIDMKELFKPVNIMDIREQLRKQELLRAKRMAEEKAKKAQEQQSNKPEQSSNTPFNPAGSLSGSGSTF